MGAVPMGPLCFWIDSEEDPNFLEGHGSAKSSRIAKCEANSYIGSSCFAAAFQDFLSVQNGEEIVRRYGHVGIDEFLTDLSE
jgi:hypothetical protein